MTSNETQGRARAETFRRRYALGLAPVKDVFELVHATLGVDVLSMNAPDAEHGLTMKDSATGVIVVAVATTPHPMRQRTSIAHEAGHVVAGDVDRDTTTRPGDRSPAEVQADAFARHLLLPIGAVTAEHLNGEPVTEPDLSVLVQEFEVSPAVAAIQLCEAGLISAAQKTQWAQLTASHLATTYGWLSQYRSLAAESQRERAPQRLMSRAVAGYHGGVVDLAELARWYGQEPAALAEELESHPHAHKLDEQLHAVDPDDDWQAPLFPGSPGAAS